MSAFGVVCLVLLLLAFTAKINGWRIVKMTAGGIALLLVFAVLLSLQ